jgi:hypothetical protein
MKKLEPDYQRFRSELEAFQACGEPTDVSLPPLAALAIVLYIQSTLKNMKAPRMTDLPNDWLLLSETAEKIARQLQELFDADKVMELGWSDD